MLPTRRWSCHGLNQGPKPQQHPRWGPFPLPLYPRSQHQLFSGRSIRSTRGRGRSRVPAAHRPFGGHSYLGRAAVTLLSPLHELVPAHGSPVQLIRPGRVPEAIGARVPQELPHVLLAAAAEQLRVNQPGGAQNRAGEQRVRGELEGHPQRGGDGCNARPDRATSLVSPIRTLPGDVPPFLLHSPDAACHDTAPVSFGDGAVAAGHVLVVGHAQVVPHLVSHGGRGADGVGAVVLRDKELSVG